MPNFHKLLPFLLTAFHRVSESPVSVPTCWNYFVESSFHISPNIRIRVLVNCERSRGVLDKQIAEPNIDLRQVLSNSLVDVARDEVTPSRWRSNGYFVLEPHRLR